MSLRNLIIILVLAATAIVLIPKQNNSSREKIQEEIQHSGKQAHITREDAAISQFGSEQCFANKIPSGIQYPGERIGYDYFFIRFSVEKGGRVHGFMASYPFGIDSSWGNFDGVLTSNTDQELIKSLYHFQAEGMRETNEVDFEIDGQGIKEYYGPREYSEKDDVYYYDGQPTGFHFVNRVNCDEYEQDMNRYQSDEPRSGIINSPETIARTLLAAVSGAGSEQPFQRSSMSEGTEVSAILNSTEKRMHMKRLLAQYFQLGESEENALWKELERYDLVGEWETVLIERYEP